ncbi:DUF805 domain-containing protein [Streptomyces sp. NPDC052052]|uniref:DUF805 domain-containing protein n=1 Tax=Streptomyces sp. NPDC052052 TaxID=3154756 RepID=UPI0034257C03
MQWYLDVLKQYAVFNGRARRQEFWMYVLFNVIAIIIVSVIDSLIDTAPALTGLYYLAVLLPSLGVSVRRLHDTGRSGWWLLIGFVPLVGAITLLVFTCIEGDRSANAYGPDPKATQPQTY